MDETTIRPAQNPAKAYLRRYRAMLVRQESLKRSIEAAYDRAYSCTARIKPVTVSGGNGAYDRMAEDVAKIADETELLRGTLEDVSAALKDVLRAIEAVPDEMQKTVLTLRYVEGLEWSDICKQLENKLRCSERTIFILHGRGLWNVRKWMEANGVV